jgi:hypothetical protein
MTAGGKLEQRASSDPVEAAQQAIPLPYAGGQFVVKF